MKKSNPISLAQAEIPFKSMKNLIDCIQTQRIGRGKYVEQLEKKAREYFGVEHCIAVCNGTMADIIMLATMKEMFPGRDEVILPALTFVAHANSVVWNGLKPVFVDVKEDGLMDASEAFKYINEKTLCFFPVHLLGKTAPLFGFEGSVIPVIEDCCEAMGGTYFNIDADKMISNKGKVGTAGLAGSFSMYPSHTITTGEGGLIITNHSGFASIARSIHNHGKVDRDFDFNYIGINGKMTNLQAAIGCELINRIDKINDLRKENVRIYNSLFHPTVLKDFRTAGFHATAPHCYPVILESKQKRDECLKKLYEMKIEARKLMGCVPDYAPYIKRYGKAPCKEYPNARHIAECGLFLPIHHKLKREEIERIADVVSKFR